MPQQPPQVAQPTIQPILVRGLHRGMADSSVLSDSMMPAEQMRYIQNMDTDAIGFLTRRSGYTRLGTGAVSGTSAIAGIHQHVGTNNQLLAFSSGESFYLSGNVWTQKTLSFSNSVKIHAVSFLDYVLAVDGIHAPKSWTGSVADNWGTTLLVNAPIGSLIETYKQQVYIADPVTDTVRFSSIPTAGNITWPAANSFVVDPNDGSHLTAMTRYGQELLLFKKDYMYRFNASSIEPDPIIFNGTPSQEAVAVAGRILFFYDSVRQSMYGYAGGYPNWISKPISSFVKAVPTSSVSSVCATYDNDHVEWFLGNITVAGVALTGMAARYTISSKTWTLRSYANSFKVFAPYDDGTTLFMLGGTSVSDVVKMDTGNSDLGAAISFQIETPWYVIGNNPAVEFTMSALSVFAENSTGNMDVQYKTDRDNTWRSIGSSRQFVTTWSGINARFHRIKFRFTGTSSADALILDGFSILTPIVEGVPMDSMVFNL